MNEAPCRFTGKDNEWTAMKKMVDNPTHDERVDQIGRRRRRRRRADGRAASGVGVGVGVGGGADKSKFPNLAATMATTVAVAPVRRRRRSFARKNGWTHVL